MSEKRKSDGSRPASLPRLSPDSSANVYALAPVRRGRAEALLAPGALFGRRYRITSQIGAGGMGVVYGAVEVATNTEVAIKVLGSGAASPSNLRRFRREGQTAAAVVHRHCCRILGVGVDGGAPYIVMERLEGETLRRRLVETGPVSAADAVAIMLQMLEGLSAAHAAGVLHRDIKPGNIFVTTPRGAPPSIKIIDFGLAKLLPFTSREPTEDGDEEVSAITTTDVVPGTPMYLAPEQISGQRDLDERVDVWAAGLTLYEMLLNRRAFSGSSYIALAQDIIFTTLPAVTSVRSDIPAGFDRLLARALAKQRDRRFASAAAFRQALLAEWASFRAAGVIRGEEQRKPRGRPRPEPQPRAQPQAARELPPLADELELDDPTEINVDIHFEPDDLG